MSATQPRPTLPTFRAEREFGLLVGGVAAALGLWWTWRDKFAGARPWLLGAGALLILAGLLLPRGLRPLYRVWMGLAEVLARVVTTVILALVFYLVVTPIGVFKRLRGWDPLERRAAAVPGASWWRPYPARQHDPRHFERMY